MLFKLSAAWAFVVVLASIAPGQVDTSAAGVFGNSPLGVFENPGPANNSDTPGNAKYGAILTTRPPRHMQFSLSFRF